MDNNNHSLHIHMELCSDNLRNILDNKHFVFNREKDHQMNEVEYYISCKIFIELLEAVNYLHEQSPPIIHRDIKPANILFSENGTATGIFFKLCDFGLAKLYDGTSNTRAVGTNKYMAPEVWDGNYNNKADIYSLSIVLNEILNLDKDYDNSLRSEKLKEYFEIIEDLLEDMRKMNHRKRPDCKNIIDGKDKWCLASIPPIDLQIG